VILAKDWADADHKLDLISKGGDVEVINPRKVEDPK
jgi:hypothetical protein